MEKSLDEVPEGVALGDQTNRVFSGSFVTYGRASFEVTEVGMSTEVGKIAGLLKMHQRSRHRFKRIWMILVRSCLLQSLYFAEFYLLSA